MQQSRPQWPEQSERHKKIVFWTLLVAGIAVLVVGIVSIAILAVVGALLMASGIGGVFLGRYLLRLAQTWRQEHLINTAGHGNRVD